MNKAFKGRPKTFFLSVITVDSCYHFGKGDLIKVSNDYFYVTRIISLTKMLVGVKVR